MSGMRGYLGLRLVDFPSEGFPSFSRMNWTRRLFIDTRGRWLKQNCRNSSTRSGSVTTLMRPIGFSCFAAIKQKLRNHSPLATLRQYALEVLRNYAYTQTVAYELSNTGMWDTEHGVWFGADEVHISNDGEFWSLLPPAASRVLQDGRATLPSAIAILSLRSVRRGQSINYVVRKLDENDDYWFDATFRDGLAALDSNPFAEESDRQYRELIYLVWSWHQLRGCFPRQADKQTLYRVMHRDGMLCRYCGENPGGKLQFDHVIPFDWGGPSIETNLVVACRKCNLKKKNRLPHQAGLTLRPIEGHDPFVKPSAELLQSLGVSA